MTRPAILASWVVLVSACVGLSWLFWSLLWPFHFLESHEGAWNIINKDKIVHSGETALVNWRGCRYTDLPAQVDTELRGALLIMLPTRVSNIAAGCRTFKYPIVYVSPDIPPGKYKARIVISFTVNSLRTVKYRYETDEFQIVR